MKLNISILTRGRYYENPKEVVNFMNLNMSLFTYIFRNMFVQSLKVSLPVVQHIPALIPNDDVDVDVGSTIELKNALLFFV